MNIKNIITNFFTYKPEKQYEFKILETDENQKDFDKESHHSAPKKIYPDLNQNLEHMKSSYNTLINSDIIIREFTLNARNKQYNAFLFYIDGMIDTNIMNDFILKPLMLKNKSNSYEGNENRIISEGVTNNVTIRKVKKFDISKYLLSSLMPQNSVTELDSFEEIFSGINSGNCALFVDTLSTAFDIEVKGFKQRSIDSPNNEIVVKGPQEAFVENIRTNTSILRRLINNENLIIEDIKIGDITQTKCGLCYIKSIANDDLVGEARYRMNNLAIDSLVSTGQLEQLISDENELRNTRNAFNRKT